MVREVVESRRGCHLRRRCCVAIPPLGPWCVRGLWERQCLCWVSCLWGHSRLLAEGTKEEEKREEDVAVLGLGGEGGDGREGTTGLANCVPQTQLLVATVARTQVTPELAPNTESLERRSEPGVEKFQSPAPGCCAVFLEAF